MSDEEVEDPISASEPEDEEEEEEVDELVVKELKLNL